MSHSIVHDMTAPWVSSDGALMSVAVDTGTFPGPGAASNLLTAAPGSTGTTVSFTPGSPIDLLSFGEIRFWIRASRPANGRPESPFFLEVSYRVDTEPPGVRHRWLVPVNRSNRWEQRRINIASDSRNPIEDFQFQSLSDSPFECRIAELVAVNPEMQADSDEALRRLLNTGVALPQQSNLPLTATSPIGAEAVRIPLTAGFAVDNEVLLRNAVGDEVVRQLISVADDTGTVPPTTVLGFAGSPVPVAFPLVTSNVSLVAPVVFVSKIGPIPTANPQILVSSLDVIEDLERTAYYRQRDSFRRVGGRIVSGTRPAPRAYRLSYQVIVNGQDRVQEVFLHDQVLSLLSIQNGLRINGRQAPLTLLPAQSLSDRQTGYPVYLSRYTPPVYLSVATFMDVEARTTVTSVQTATVGADHPTPPHDPETITVTL